MNKYISTLFITLLIVFQIPLLAQSDRVAGKIRGRVFDKNSNEPLMGANIVLLPTSTGRGAMTDKNGYFVIPNIPAGDYDLKATYIGYAPLQFNGLQIIPGQTLELDFALNVEAIEGQEVIVFADASESIVKVKTVTSQLKLSGEEINRMPVSDFLGVLANAGGVTETESGRSRGIHIRGGRSGEVAYFVDGIQTNDPVDRSQGIELDKEAIDNIVISTGGFSAEYGEAMSGVVNIVTKSGKKDRYSGMIIMETDEMFSQENILNTGYSKYNIGIGGPVPGFKNTMSFYSSTSLLSGNIRNPRFVKIKHSDYTLPQGTFKIVYSPTWTTMNMTLAGSYSKESRNSYSHSISKGSWLDDYYQSIKGHRRLSLQIQNVLGDKSAWRLMIWFHEPYNEFGSNGNQNYKDYKYISTRLDWVDYAVDKGWYDPKSRQWNDITDESGLPLISNNYYTFDQIAGATESNPFSLSSLNQEYQAFFYYYFKEKNQYNISSGQWASESDRTNAYNERWHSSDYWFIPAFQKDNSIFYDLNDTTANQRIFDDSDYAEYLLGNDEYKRTHDLWGYNGNIHNGWYWDRDLFNVFTYGPGRPRSHRQISSHKGMEFHLSSQWSLRNQVKFGIMVKQSDMEYMDIQFANQNPYFDSYNYKPLSAASWLENSFEYEDFIAMTGLRWDYFNPNADAIDNTDVFDVDGDGEVDRSPAKVKSQFSPRMGMNFSASDKTALYMNYGYFFQMPEYGEIYQNIYADLTSGLPLIGNPDIEPEKTVQYQFGLIHKFTDKLGLEITAYYKDVLNLLATRTNTVVFNGTIATVTTQEMEDFAKIKGVDFKLKFNQFYNLSGDISYSYLSAKGTGSSNREFYYLYIYESDRPLPSKEYPLEFDVSHSLKTNLNYYVPPSSKNLKGLILGNWNFNIQANFSTGIPYTPQDQYGKPLELGSKRMPGTKRIDMRIEKYLAFVSIYLDLRNVFNWKNTTYVYPYSGEPDTNGRPPAFERNSYIRYVGQKDPETGRVFQSPEEAYDAHLSLWKELLENPYNYSSPRIVRLGISVSF